MLVGCCTSQTEGLQEVQMANLQVQDKVICGGGFTDKDGISWNWGCPEGQRGNSGCYQKDCCYYPFYNKESYANPKYPLNKPSWDECCKGAEEEYKKLNKMKCKPNR